MNMTTLLSNDSAVARPWVKCFAAGVPANIEVPYMSIYGLIAQTAKKYPAYTAIDYMGRRFTYSQFIEAVDECAQSLLSYGIRPGDSVTLSLPNVPNALMLFYALNKISARVCMTHPLSSPKELEHYVTQTNSRWAVTLDLFYDRFAEMLHQGKIERLVIAHISDYLPFKKKAGFRVTKGRKIGRVPEHPYIIPWKTFFSHGQNCGTKAVAPEPDPHSGSVVLFSGGTTELPKGILLTSYNFNALAVQTQAITGLIPKDSVLAILPVFHGFGLGLCIHTCLCIGGMSILVPEFSTKTYISSLIKHEPTVLAGVPTLFEALMRDENFKKVSFTRLKGAYSGGDSLYPGIKQRFDHMIKSQGSKVELKEGYGLTETVTACAISPDVYRENSMGVPIPNMLAKIVKPDTEQEQPCGVEGEICIAGPTIMKEYLNAPEETKKTLREHTDGFTWLHTGDLGCMDSDGYLYFKNRIKRILKVSGFSVYPMQVEQVLESHPAVFKACVIGVPDDYQMTSVKAFVVLNDKSTNQEAVRHELIAHCHKNLIKWSVPRKIEFRDSLPTTLVGKVAYTRLEQEELSKISSKEAS